MLDADLVEWRPLGGESSPLVETGCVNLGVQLQQGQAALLR